jgi:hypothetical protein
VKLRIEKRNRPFEENSLDNGGELCVKIKIVMFLRIGLLVLLSIVGGGLSFGAPNVDDLPDLTGGVIPLLNYDTGSREGGGGELFTGRRLSQREEVRYSVRVKNQTGDPIEADSLIVVVEKIQEMARLRDVTTELDLPGSDGTTQDGKPYFRMPVGGKATLAPYMESEAITIEIRNPDLLRLYPPVLRVRGVRRTPSQAFQSTLETLVRRGVLTPEEARNAMEQKP